MKRFKNVLVVYDDAIGGEDALSQAVALSSRNRAHLAIATVLGEGQPPGIHAEAAKRIERLVASVGDWFTGHFKTHDARLHSRLGDHPH